MYKGEQLTAFRKNWSQTANDSQELGRFLTRVDDAMRQIWDTYLMSSDRIRERFALISGTPKLSWNQRNYAYTEMCATFRLTPITLYQITEQIQFVLWALQAEKPEDLP